VIEDRRDDLTAWLREQLRLDGRPGDVFIDGLDRADLGHSAEMFMLSLVSDGAARRTEVVVRMRPPEPGLLEPYDLQRQFDVMTALHTTAVKAPRALWLEPTGDVLGRPFLVMERLAGDVFEQQAPPDEPPGRLRRMAESLVDELAVIHLVDLRAAGLEGLADGTTFIDRELDRWAGELRRVQRGPLPALERLHDELRTQRPAPSGYVTLVHGDAKPGNFAFEGDAVSAVFDWELADIGDPLADVGYLDQMWRIPVGITSKPTSLGADEFIARYEERTGFTVTNREWYRAFQVFKLSVIQLIASMLFDAGHTDDRRAVAMAMGVELMTPMGLRDLGVDEELDMGPIYPREERMAMLRKGNR
jgi:aminoglycoside phosphotransferase (APT) family kinase protein